MFLAKLCGEDKPSGIAEWVKLREKRLTKMLGLKRESMPNHNTYRRIWRTWSMRKNLKHWPESTSSTVAQIAIGTKQNEITVAPNLFGYIDLRNKVAIGDALHTQRQISIQIGAANGNYLWVVKGNQPQLLQDLQDWFDTTIPLLPGIGCLPKDFCSATTTSKGHSRLEVRTSATCSNSMTSRIGRFCNKSLS